MRGRDREIAGSESGRREEEETKAGEWLEVEKEEQKNWEEERRRKDKLKKTKERTWSEDRERREKKG